LWGEETQRDIWGTHTRENRRGQAVDKTPYYDKAGQVSDFFGRIFAILLKLF